MARATITFDDDDYPHEDRSKRVFVQVQLAGGSAGVTTPAQSHALAALRAALPASHPLLGRMMNLSSVGGALVLHVPSKVLADLVRARAEQLATVAAQPRDDLAAAREQRQIALGDPLLCLMEPEDQRTQLEVRAKKLVRHVEQLRTVHALLSMQSELLSVSIADLISLGLYSSYYEP